MTTQPQGATAMTADRTAVIRKALSMQKTWNKVHDAGWTFTPDQFDDSYTWSIVDRKEPRGSADRLVTMAEIILR